MRFELTRPFERYHLKVVRLPISPPTHPLSIFEVAANVGYWQQKINVFFISGHLFIPQSPDAVILALPGYTPAQLFPQNDPERRPLPNLRLLDKQLPFMILLNNAF